MTASADPAGEFDPRAATRQPGGSHSGDDGRDTAKTVSNEIDARGLSCPMPVIELARAVEKIDIGDRVRLLATDPAARVDVPVWCRMQRQRLCSQDEDQGVATFVIERLR